MSEPQDWADVAAEETLWVFINLLGNDAIPEKMHDSLIAWTAKAIRKALVERAPKDARECAERIAAAGYDSSRPHGVDDYERIIAAYGARVRAEEREACAKLCDHFHEEMMKAYPRFAERFGLEKGPLPDETCASNAAQAIRARGEGGDDG